MLKFMETKTANPSVKEIKFLYKNWRGESSLRTAIPLKLWYGATEWHPTEQWFITAFDVEKGEERDFALLDMQFDSDVD